MNKRVNSLLLGLTLGVGLAVWTPVQADNRAMLKLLEVLHDNGTINDEAYRMLVDAARSDSGEVDGDASSAAAGDVAPSTPEEPETGVALTDSGLDVRNRDLGARLRLGGRLHLDSARYNDDQIPLGDGSEVRRIRLEARARVAGDWAAKGSIELSGNEVDLKSTYLQYLGFENTAISVGNFKEPFSLEELSSSNDTTFMERAMMTELSPGRHFGIGASRWGDNATFTAGVFGEGISSDTEDDAGWGASARTTWFPVHAADRTLHLGAAIAYRETGDDDSFRVRARPESHVTDVRLVDTGVISGVNDIARIGLEAAGIMGPLSLQGEYAASGLGRGGGLPDLDFSGWYVQGSWVLTGESRSYKAESGKIGGVIPEYNLGAGSLGAWELAARYSTIDLTDGALIGGEQDNLTLGLNWYVSPNIRFMFNYVNVLDVKRPGAPEDGDKPHIAQVRAQFNY